MAGVSSFMTLLDQLLIETRIKPYTTGIAIPFTAQTNLTVEEKQQIIDYLNNCGFANQFIDGRGPQDSEDVVATLKISWKDEPK